ncbi:hypothetical protein [Clostridium butyricum]|uniref:Uncharacterized protein n=1 Tax=Clostridium butyricum TaxID=1492 RepID=A0A2S7F9E1_CLOBU|nr:hypothetical protein [Clostridium butyricum]KHD14360.1 hypothetical protein OA81_15905 [Clostridium butyricum]PPV14003.1 hypothetical protein AWN73_15205 [Clostridium butyricum]
MSKWTYEIDVTREIWRGGVYNTKEKAIENGKKDAIEDGKQSFKVGIIEEPTNFGVDVDQIINNIQEAMYDDIGEVAEDYLDDVSNEDALDLEKRLNEVFCKWQEEHNYKPSFYKVISEEILYVD